MPNELTQSTPEIHDQVKAKMNIDRDPPAGMVFHPAGPMEGGGQRALR